MSLPDPKVGWINSKMVELNGLTLGVLLNEPISKQKVGFLNIFYLKKKKTLSLFGYSYNLAYEVHIVNWKCIVSNLMSGEIFPFRSFWTLNISLVKFSSKASYYFNMITPLVKTTLTFLPISIDSLMTWTPNLETSITLLTHICTFYFLEPTKKLDLSLQQISVVTVFLAVF